MQFAPQQSAADEQRAPRIQVSAASTLVLDAPNSAVMNGEATFVAVSVNIFTGVNDDFPPPPETIGGIVGTQLPW